MTDQGEHVITEQENALYEYMTAGDWDTVDQLRQDAYTADPTPPDPLPEDWLPPREQFDADYAAAHAHYQADHEAPEEAREAATKEQVHEQNTDASQRADTTEEPPA